MESFETNSFSSVEEEFGDDNFCDASKFSGALHSEPRLTFKRQILALP
jgi:hypothetical protein